MRLWNGNEIFRRVKENDDYLATLMWMFWYYLLNCKTGGSNVKANKSNTIMLGGEEGSACE